MSEELVKAAFRSADKNRDGSITREELGTIMQKLDPSLTQAELDSLFKAADKDGSGTIDVAEWVAWVFGGGDSAAKDIMAWAHGLKEGDSVPLSAGFKVLDRTTTDILLQGPDGAKTWFAAEDIYDDIQASAGKDCAMAGVVIARTTTDLKVAKPDGSESWVGLEDVVAAKK
eukprot:TRINITY_DN112691_c0_g1_i1.p2 TRINITY_DN112691_c0_g1~~TRINITY_DN112691_c0_g1_i1.p2  ORF type:complete len:196 (+),score=51.76 TRINITY_DN112691_c0_g1_i1:75-590(+)